MKYPKTPHLPWSPGKNDDKEDKVLQNTDHFLGVPVIYLEKLDGECTTCSRHGIHARSEDSITSPWQTYMARMHACFQYKIPEGMFICGECMYATHSIFYENLPSCFFVFCVLYNN